MADDKSTDSHIEPVGYSETIQFEDIKERFNKHIILGEDEQGWYIMLGGAKNGLSFGDLCYAWESYTDHIMREASRIIGDDVEELAKLTGRFEESLQWAVRKNIMPKPPEDTDGN